MHRLRTLGIVIGLGAATLGGCSRDSGTANANNGPAVKASELAALTVDEVAAKLAAHDGHTFVYDNNPRESWVRGHVPTATWLDDENVTAGDLPADKAATLIFYCHNET